MKLCKAACCFAVIVPLLAGGCATFPDRSNPDTDNAADVIHEHLDKALKVTVDKEDASGRLLRAYFLVAAFSVYGNASIERYSHSPGGDAGALLGRIMAAEAALQAALNDVNRNYYPVDRARLVYTVADLAARAVRPTTTMAVGLIGTTPTPAGGARLALDIFRNAVENVVFGEAYLEGFRRSVCQLNADEKCSAQPLSAQLKLTPGAAAKLDAPAWTDLREILKTTCEALKVKARLQANAAMQCGTIRARPAGKPAPAG